MQPNNPSKQINTQENDVVQSAPQQVTSEGSKFKQLPAIFKKHATLFIVVGVVLIVGGFTTGLFLNKLAAATPDGVFKTALAHAYSTQSVTQNVTADSLSVATNFDLSKTKDPRVYARLDLKQTTASPAYAVTGYGSERNQYAKFSAASGNYIPASAVDKWIQLVKDGRSVADHSQINAVVQAFDPSYAAVSDYVYGNFSADDRNSLMRYVLQQKVYSYNSHKVMTAKIGSQEVYVYTVTVDGKKVTELNKRVAKVMGLNAETVANAFNDSNDKVTLYITKSNSQLIKLVEDGDYTIIYSKFNQTKLPAEPKAQLQFDAIVLAAREDADSKASTEMQDTIRKSDIDSMQNHLEAYYADNNRYPTLAEFNDASWRAKNMADFNTIFMHDPSGGNSVRLVGNPMPHAFAYQVGTDNSLASCEKKVSTCQYYVLTATLSDNSTYSKETID